MLVVAPVNIDACLITEGVEDSDFFSVRKAGILS